MLNSNIGLFISPSRISELDCATTKTDTAERSISIGRESLQVFFCTRALAYFQVPPLGGSRDEKCSRVRKSRRDLWITLYIVRLCIAMSIRGQYVCLHKDNQSTEMSKDSSAENWAGKEKKKKQSHPQHTYSQHCHEVVFCANAADHWDSNNPFHC